MTTDYRFRKATKALIEQAQLILHVLHPMSLRGVHYQMVSRGVYENTPNNYKRLGRAMTAAREQGLIPWGWIVDNLRQTMKPSSWTGLDDFADTVRDAYRKDFWARMPAHVEIFVEKDAMAATIQPATRGYDVALHVMRGYMSTSYAHTIASQWTRIKKPIYAYYMGDWDPSGLDLERDAREKLERYSGRTVYDADGEYIGGQHNDDDSLVSMVFGCGGIFTPPELQVTWTRLGVVEGDFDEHDLITLPTKAADRRSRAFVAQYGDRAAELDAVPADVLRARAETAISEHIDADEWNRLIDVEQAEKATFNRVLDQLTA